MTAKNGPARLSDLQAPQRASPSTAPTTRQVVIEPAPSVMSPISSADMDCGGARRSHMHRFACRGNIDSEPTREGGATSQREWIEMRPSDRVYDVVAPTGGGGCTRRPHRHPPRPLPGRRSGVPRHTITTCMALLSDGHQANGEDA